MKFFKHTCSSIIYFIAILELLLFNFTLGFICRGNTNPKLVGICSKDITGSGKRLAILVSSQANGLDLYRACPNRRPVEFCCTATGLNCVAPLT
ncbi:hypothetical protein BY996DRAFT_6967785 [Phakopsora pachyrhizi]|nr:hypothetical protein BY996DRAFT_6967785 [Phakopsora pachyrhizi]